MKGKEIQALRERYAFTQKDLTEMLNDALGRKASPADLSKWERGVKDTPADVAEFLDRVQVAKGLPVTDAPGHSAPPPPEDTAPSGGGSDLPPPQVPIGNTRSIYARTCEQLWESVAVGVGSVGALLGSQALMVDGQIIEQDQKELGRVWGQLAETNETFRKMLTGLSTGGAGLQVAIVTGTTVGKMLQNHQQVKMNLAIAEAENGGAPTYADAFPPVT